MIARENYLGPVFAIYSDKYTNLGEHIAPKQRRLGLQRATLHDEWATRLDRQNNATRYHLGVCVREKTGGGINTEDCPWGN